MFQADDNSKQSWNTHDHSRTAIYKSMTSANGGNYAGQYPCDDCDGWVDNLEPTLLIPTMVGVKCFLREAM